MFVPSLSWYFDEFQDKKESAEDGGFRTVVAVKCDHG
jgi:hypothetical protein